MRPVPTHVITTHAHLTFSCFIQEVIGAACEMWTHHLPPEHRIASRRLARQIQRANGNHVWVTLQPQRFVDLVRNGPVDDLELRLQIECTTPPSPIHERQHGARSPSTLGKI
jgi:hypothetical protein